LATQGDLGREIDAASADVAAAEASLAQMRGTLYLSAVTRFMNGGHGSTLGTLLASSGGLQDSLQREQLTSIALNQGALTTDSLDASATELSKKKQVLEKKRKQAEAVAKSVLQRQGATEELIAQVEEPMLVTIYLEGEFPAGFQRLQAETVRLLDEFRARNRNIRYELVNPSENPDPQVRRDTYTQLQNLADGVKTQQVFPGAVVSYNERQWPVSLLLEQFAQAPEAQINASIQNLEYALAASLRGLLQTERKRVAFIDGHGELAPIQTAALELNLRKSYDVFRFNLREFPVDSTTGEPSLTEQVRRLNSFDGIILAKSRESFAELDRWLLDQYLMNNGRAIWMVEAVHAEMDSLSYASEFLAYPQLDFIGLDGLLFTYGARVNTSLATDLVCAGVNDQRSVRPWVYFPGSTFR
ncbi:MAG: hypothetical protein RL104_798, partial [Bacteroidota bacterium]